MLNEGYVAIVDKYWVASIIPEGTNLLEQILITKINLKQVL